MNQSYDCGVGMKDTRERILDSAERLFAERGFSGVSLRAIINNGGVNLAAVHYHFGSKEALLKAVVLRRTEPANRERVDMLDQLEREAGSGTLELEKVIEAFVFPAFRAAHDPARNGPVFQVLMGRLYAEGDILPSLVATHFSTMLTRFGSALTRSLPELPLDELVWRTHFALGAIAQALRGMKDWETFRGVGVDRTDSDLVVKRLVAFLAAAFRAPVTQVMAKARGET